MTSIILPTEEIMVQANPGETIASALGRASIRLYAPCAGRGICGKCRVVTKRGPGLSSPNDIERAQLSEEELSSGVRLACQATLSGDADVTILSAGNDHHRSASILTEGQFAVGHDENYLNEARIKMKTVWVNPESPARSDLERIALALESAQSKETDVNSSYNEHALAAAPNIQLAQAVGEAMSEAMSKAEAMEQASTEIHVHPSGPAATSSMSAFCSGNRGAAMTCVFIDDELIDVLPATPRLAEKNRTCRIPEWQSAHTEWTPLGIAVDIGTTTVVAYLVNLVTGEIIGAKGTVNPQARHGADLISRIVYSESEGGLETLRREVIEAINTLSAELLKEAGASADDVYLISAVGNTCMHHLCCGIAPGRLARIPYSPAVLESAPISPTEAGLAYANPRGKFFFLPNIAGFVGSDALAVALVSGMSEDSVPTLAIDIGTNGEILLAANDRILACSTAAGPAFEGVNISCGMIAAPGAIDSARIGKADIEFHVIGNARPVGICGSGLISLVAALREVGIISESGAFTPDAVNPSSSLGNRLVEGRGGLQFVLAEPAPGTPSVILTQRDVRELQLAKAAIRAGVEILLAEAGIATEDLSQTLLAGAFGTHLDVEAATDIGLLPASSAARVATLGNAAGHGAILALTSAKACKDARRLARMAEHVELGSNPEFMQVFADSMLLSRA